MPSSFRSLLKKGNTSTANKKNGRLIKYYQKPPKRRLCFAEKTSQLYYCLTFAGLLVLSAVTWLPRFVSVSSTVGGRELPIYCVETEKPQISISFDAAWGNEDTQTLLDILAAHQVKATFFMTGGWVESYPEDVKKIYEAGHDLGNHSQNHKYMSKLSDEEKTQELMSVHQRVKELTGYDMFLFRPPYGDYDSAVVTNARQNGYYPIQWNIDSLDWKDYGAEDIIKKITENKNLSNGSIILCHNEPNTPRMLWTLSSLLYRTRAMNSFLFPSLSTKTTIT